MAQLSDLPNEIILLTLPLVLPDYIESFSGTCKKHYSLAAEELERHRALKREHAVYKFPDFHSRGASRLLDVILQEPRIAFYVREITLKGWNSEWTTDPEYAILPREQLHLHHDRRFQVRLAEAVSEFGPEDITWGWMPELNHGNEDPVISLLLLLLPNLSKLRFEGFGSERANLRDTLDRIARMQSPNAPLSLLRHVDLLCDWDVSAARILRHITALPSIRSMHVEKIGTHVSFSNLTVTELTPQTSKLEKLTLLRCRVSFKSLNYILAGLTALRSFTFVAERYLDFDSVWFRDALFAVAGSTLESLTLLSRNEKRNVIGDVRVFENLRNLHTETQLLLDDFAFSCDETSLAKALPPNLQTLKLECSGQGDEVFIGRNISKLAELKKDLVPHLKEVEVSTRNGIKDFNRLRDGAFFTLAEAHSYEALVKACHAQGFNFRVTTLEERATRDLLSNPSSTS